MKKLSAAVTVFRQAMNHRNGMAFWLINRK
jgi:hypothetical protein